MAEINLERELDAPIEHVFDILSDHAAYAENFRGISSSSLSREGETERNGLGAMRKIASGPLRFSEEITAFERPTRMDYLIREVNIPFEHHGGSIRLEEVAGRTRVRWVSRFTFRGGLAGRPLGALGAAVFTKSFSDVLKQTEALAAERSAQ
jgi:carbon monoxide dehydrogenase subunit G